MKLTRSLSLIALASALVAAPLARAVTFTLNNSTATLVDGNIVSTFYQATPASDSGTMAPTFTFSYTGTGTVTPVNSPYTIEIFFNGPQPVLTEAFFKASDRYMYWDAADLTAFNSGVYTSITLVGNGLLNPPGNAYNGLSHAGLSGTVGTNPPGGSGVPDGGSTAVMLGLGLIAMAVALRRRS